MWFYFAVLSAVSGSVATLARRTHGSTSRPVELAWWTQMLTIPFSGMLVLLTHQRLYINHGFLLPAVASAALASFACVLCFSAYKYGDASVICPLSNLQPIALLISSFIMFGTTPSLMGLVGILFIVFGVYYTSVNGKHSLLQPLTAVWKQRGSRAMLGCIIIWSVTTNLDKIALRSASPAFYMFFDQIAVFILLTMYVFSQPMRREGIVWHKWWKHIVLIAVFATFAFYFQNKALSLTSSSYMFAVKRLDTLIIILFAGLLLHEKHILRRFKGSTVALIGVAIIYLAR